MSSTAVVEHITPWWQTAIQAILIGSAVLTGLGLIMTTVSKLSKKKED